MKRRSTTSGNGTSHGATSHGQSRAPWARRLAACLGLAVLVLAVPARPVLAKVRIASSTTDLAAIAASIGGDLVEVYAIARANADPHRVEVLPSYMVRVSRAQIYLKVGLSLDPWADRIIDGSQNGDLVIVDCSKDVAILEKPAGKVDASMGDVHPDGNPHYWLDPRNGAVVAGTIAAALARVDPEHAGDYAAGAERFGREVESLVQRGAQLLANLPSRDIVTYHRSWSYFAHAFGLDVVSTMEPFPGIPPTGKHLQELVNIIKERKVAVALQEPYFSDDAGKFLARATGIRVAKISASCADTSAGSYAAHFDALFAIMTGGAAATSP